MTTIDSSAATSVLDQYRPQAAVKDEKLGKNAFLELMIAQLEHQDPLSPQENGEFIAQLAQFSQVEGLDNLNTAVGGMNTAMRSTLALQASTLVGRSVRVPTESGVYDGSTPMTGVAVLPSAATNVHVRISDAQGREVRVLDYGTREGGNLPVAWDGRDGDGVQQPAGRYTIKAEGNFGDGNAAASVELLANVNSVSIAADGEVVLNVAGVGAVAMGDVREVH
jgi:flagellar basal-body rod modification protein FlgD